MVRKWQAILWEICGYKGTRWPYSSVFSKKGIFNIFICLVDEWCALVIRIYSCAVLQAGHIGSGLRKQLHRQAELKSFVVSVFVI